ncbi:hypothetical protein CRUP_003859, partial [Coryphaenoides rupestris]
NLYFTNAFERQTYLEVLAINTTHRLVLLKAAAEDRPRDLAVSPKLRLLFWTDGGQNPKIERALLDGTNRSVLASGSLGSPRGLTVDYASDFLYWTDDALDAISRMATDGTQRQIVRYGSRLPGPMGLAVFGNYLLWVDRKLGKLFQASKDPANTDPPQVIRDGMDGLVDVAVFDPATQPTAAQLVGFNPCQKDNGRCQQLCFAEAPRCACAHGSLLSNGVTCGYDLDDFLVFSTDYTLNSLRLDPADHSSPFPAVTLGYNLLALDYHHAAKRVFFAQYSGTGRSRVGYGVAYDWVHQRLYWTEYSQKNIQAVGVDGGNRSLVAQANRPKAIIVDPCYGYLYWTDWGYPASIERATLAGNFRSSIIDNGLSSPTGLTMDVDERMLYWTDSNRALHSDGPRTGRWSLHGVQYPYALTVHQQDVFWTDWTTRAVYRAGPRTTARASRTGPNDIHVYTAAKQGMCASPCQQFNGGCSHVCVSGPSGPECQCPQQGSWYLANSGKDCIQVSGPRCQPGEFTCLSGACILARWTCDGEPDCQDGSDELERVCADRTCPSGQIKCENTNICIHSDDLCNGCNNCGDNSDENPLFCDCADGSDEAERQCATPQPTCAPLQYMCVSGQCVDAGQVCNGQKDCEDNSDEKGCGINECRSPSVHKCAQVCTDTLTGYYCSCHPGYRLMADGKACADLDECRDTPAVCSQLCENAAGSYHCKCVPGYLRQPDGRACRQNSGVEPHLLYSNRYYNPQAGLSNVVGLDFDHQEKRLYWLDANSGRIERMRLEGDADRETLVDYNLGGAEALAVDWERSYWVENDYGLLVNGDESWYGRYQKSSCTGEFRVVVLDGLGGLCVRGPRWDGRPRCQGHHHGQAWRGPSGLTIDYATNKIFFADAHLNFLE